MADALRSSVLSLLILVLLIAVACAAPTRGEANLVGTWAEIQILSEYATPKVRRTIKPILEILAGIPSVVLGFFALTVINPAIIQSVFSDAASFNLAAAGFRVGKYVPYGQVREVIPYLIRRAQENTSVTGDAGRELALILQEVKRRGI